MMKKIAGCVILTLLPAVISVAACAVSGLTVYETVGVVGKVLAIMGIGVPCAITAGAAVGMIEGGE